MSQPIMRVITMISPPIFSLSDAVENDNCPTITLTATLQHTQPITIFTRPTIFTLRLAIIRHNFFCADLSSGERLRLDTLHQGHQVDTHSCQLGSDEDPYWVTFYPNKPLSFSEKFVLAGKEIPKYGHLRPGHRYRLGINRNYSLGIRWMDGVTRDDIMTTEDKRCRGPFEDAKIMFPLGDVVEFEVIE